jgi:hypothetical protein
MGIEKPMKEIAAEMEVASEFPGKSLRNPPDSHRKFDTPTPHNPRGVSIHSIFSSKYLYINSLIIWYVN